MLEKLLKLYTEALKIHIGTKTQDLVFHEFSADVYNKLFDSFHLLAEKLEDLDKGQYYGSLQDSKNRLYSIIEEVKTIVEGEKNKNSCGYDNLVRGLVDSLEGLCGTARGFTEICDDEGYEDEEEDKPLKKKLI